MMKLVLLGCFLVAATLPARANIWDSKEQLEKRWGKPIEITGYPDERTYTYQTGSYQVRVRFLDGFSQSESYRHLGAAGRQPSLSSAEIESLLQSNSFGQEWERAEEKYWLPDRSVRAYVDFENFYLTTSQYSDFSFYASLHPRTGEELTFSGRVKFRQVEESQWLVLKDHDHVLEIPWAVPGYPVPAKVKSGHTYRIALLDKHDFEGRIACLSDREHKDWSDAVYDSKSCVLTRIEDRIGTLFDRSVCEVHRLKMIKIEAEISYGLGPSDELLRFYPHYRTYIEGGCVDWGQKTGELFVCPLCVAACAVHKFTHPKHTK
jgi:hypothetical protein